MVCKSTSIIISSSHDGSVSASASSVSFPASESSSYPAPSSYQYVNRSTHLPFRRISIPSAPNLLNRQSVVSVASFDSLPEERDPALAERNGIRKSKGRPPSLDAIGKRKSRRNVRPVDEAKEAKRLKVIHEFHDTEKAYVDGLDLIYSVCSFVSRASFGSNFYHSISLHLLLHLSTTLILYSAATSSHPYSLTSSTSGTFTVHSYRLYLLS